MKAHNNPIALDYSFYDILTLNEKNQTILKSMQALRTRCLDPGLYMKYLVNWLKNFRLKQIILIDGELLRTNPVRTMNNLQRRLVKSGDFLDYKQNLRYNKEKGFFCQIVDYKKNATKCLGESKGRTYAPLDLKSKIYLNDFYKKPNLRFYRFLKARSLPIPIWIKLLS